MVNWIAGAGINVCGSIFINLGTNIMKLGHNKWAAIDMPDKAKPPVRKIRSWQIGVTLFSVGNLMNFASFAFAAQSLLAALGSIQFVSNVIFARVVLQEKATRGVYLATLCIVSGCIMLVLFGNHSSESYTAHQLLQFYAKVRSCPVYITYLIVLGASIIVSYLVYRRGKKQLQLLGPRKIPHHWNRLLPISYALFTGMLGTQSVLFSKALSTLLRTTIQGQSQLGSWFTWITLIVFILTAAFWVTRLNKALKLFPAIVIVPTMQISWTLFSILSGMVYFKEYEGFHVLSACMFVIGVLVVFVGVYLLTQSKPPDAGSSHYADLQETLPDDRPGDDAAPLDDAAKMVELLADGAAHHALGLAPLQVGTPSVLDGSFLDLEQPHDRHPDQLGASQLGTQAVGPGGSQAQHRQTLLESVADDFSISPRDGLRQLLGMPVDNHEPLSVFSMPFVVALDSPRRQPPPRLHPPPPLALPSGGKGIATDPAASWPPSSVGGVPWPESPTRGALSAHNLADRGAAFSLHHNPLAEQAVPAELQPLSPALPPTNDATAGSRGGDIEMGSAPLATREIVIPTVRHVEEQGGVVSPPGVLSPSAAEGSAAGWRRRPGPGVFSDDEADSPTWGAPPSEGDASSTGKSKLVNPIEMRSDGTFGGMTQRGLDFLRNLTSPPSGSGRTGYDRAE